MLENKYGVRFRHFKQKKEEKYKEKKAKEDKKRSM